MPLRNPRSAQQQPLLPLHACAHARVPCPPARVRRVPQEADLFAAFGESDEEDLGSVSGPPEEEMHCPTNCTRNKRFCRKMHLCHGAGALYARCGGPHWAGPDAFKYKQSGAGDRCLGCKGGNELNASISEETVYKPARDRRRAEAAAAGTSFDTDLPQLIEDGKAIIDSAIDGFDGDFDMYVYVASLGANAVTLCSEAVSTIFQQTNSNTPVLRTLKYDPKARFWNNGLVPRPERRAAADSSHVFELGDTGFDLQGADDLEKAMQEYGEQIAAASDGRIKVLWRRRGAGGPKSGGPYKVGLIIIERNADGTLGPGKWVRIDEI